VGSLSADTVREFTALQQSLVTAVAAKLDVPVPELSTRAHTAVSTTEIDLNGTVWQWGWHGTGLAFRTDGRVIDCHRRLDDPSLVDAWRLSQFVDCKEPEAFDMLDALAKCGQIQQVSVPGMPWQSARFRHSSLPGGPSLASSARKSGCFVELQPGPFNATFWHDDSVYFDDEAAFLLTRPLTDAQPNWDVFGRPFHLNREAAKRLQRGFLDFGKRCLLPNRGEWAAEHDLAGIRQTADLAIGLSEWLELQLRSHENVSVLTI
jgi:hypothetical protein